MRHVHVSLESISGSPYSQSAQHNEPFLDRESHNDYEIRTWRHKATVNREGQVCIPAMALKQCLDTASYKLGLKVPGRRGANFKSFFASGFFCDHDVPISNGKALTRADAECVVISCNPQGKRGGSGRVPRYFPVFNEWNGVAEFTIVDDVISEDIFEQHVKAAGIICGIGRFRPENAGNNGRFKATKFKWENFAL